jgi:hypothetical protein
MTTIERLDGWKAAGVLSVEQHTLLTALVKHERFSVFVELSALLYVGVIAVVGGLTWTFREYVVNLGDAAILAILTLLMVLAFGYCVSKAAPYSNAEVDAPTLVFDYVLYFGCLIFSATLAFLESRFNIFHGWDTHLLLASIVFGLLAYRFDNRFVLSLALATLAAYLGLKLSMFDEIHQDRLRGVAVLYGAFLIGLGALLYHFQIKRHFLETFLQLGGNAILLALAFGSVDGPYLNYYLVALVLLASVTIYLGIHYRRFAFVAYGMLYGYGVISARIVAKLAEPTVTFLYFIVSGSLVLVALVVIARRFGRDE